MAVNSRAKGSKAERELCKWFEKWTGFKFTRVPASGGLRWKNTNATSGDIICDNERHGRRFQFSVENKSYKDIHFEHLILGNKRIKISEFWGQANADATRSNKIPILFMRYNGMAKNTYFVCITVQLYNLIPLNQSLEFEYNRFNICGPNPMVIMNSNDLLKVDYITLHKNLKTARLNEKKKKNR